MVAAPLFAQTIRYEIKIKYNHSTTPVTADITVTVTEGEPGFTYFLMTNDPVHGKILMQSEPTRKNSFTFRDVRQGKYFLKIEDSTSNQSGRTVNIKENEN
jgi:hypothetical protein